MIRLYKYRVSAKSSAGVGEPSDPVTVVSYDKIVGSSWLYEEATGDLIDSKVEITET